MKNVIKLMGLVILSMANMQAFAFLPPVAAGPVNPFNVLKAQVQAVIVDPNYSEEQLDALVPDNRIEQILAEYKEYIRHSWAALALQNPIPVGVDIMINHQGHRVVPLRMLLIKCGLEALRIKAEILAIPMAAHIVHAITQKARNLAAHFEFEAVEIEEVAIDFDAAE